MEQKVGDLLQGQQGLEDLEVQLERLEHSLVPL